MNETEEGEERGELLSLSLSQGRISWLIFQRGREEGEEEEQNERRKT